MHIEYYTKHALISVYKESELLQFYNAIYELDRYYEVYLLTNITFLVKEKDISISEITKFIRYLEEKPIFDKIEHNLTFNFCNFHEYYNFDIYNYVINTLLDLGIDLPISELFKIAHEVINPCCNIPYAEQGRMIKEYVDSWESKDKQEKTNHNS